MKRVQLGNITLYNGDCMDYLRECEDNAFELAIVDPPYGIGMDGGVIGYKGNNVFEKKQWDRNTPPISYFQELKRVSKNQIIWGANYYNVFPSRCFIVWDKGEGFYNRTYAECELAYASFDANAKIFKYDPLSRGDYKNKIHPTQKPVALYKWLLTKYAHDGDRILDTHLGSGSIAIACHDLNFSLTGIELDSDYFQKAVHRIKEHQRQLKLF